MLKLEAKPHSRRPGFLRRLRRYSASDVLVNNKCRQALLDMPSWSSWIEDAFAELLEAPNGSEIHVALSNELESGQPQTLVFMQQEVSIGRAAESDISLPLQSISRQHARISERNGEYFVEDLGSVSGTYLNGRKLDPADPRPLRAGDEVRLFPYILKAEPKYLWKRDESIHLTYSSAQILLDAEEFAASFGPEMCLFRVGVHPDLGHLLLAISRPLVYAIIARLLRSKDIALVESDREMLEFIVACVLERANRSLQFPFECSLTPLQSSPPDGKGLRLDALVELFEFRGWLRVFIPESILEKAPKQKKMLPAWTKASLKWRLALHIGFVNLGTEDMEQMEPGDIVLYTASCELLLPTGQRSLIEKRGWRVAQDESDAYRFSVEHYFEGSIAMPTDETHDQSGDGTKMADLSSLQVRMHVVLGHVEMDMNGLESLTSGSIVQLDTDTRGIVQLVVGEAVFGSGELVELENDRLGVQITRWREQ